VEAKGFDGFSFLDVQVSGLAGVWQRKGGKQQAAAGLQVLGGAGGWQRKGGRQQAAAGFQVVSNSSGGRQR
jgi:hypothetical protein